jgi:hypothetical protein
MKILVNGASISAQANGWPVQLQKKLNCELTNLSMPACGYTYVHETTVEQISREKFDLVLIMWPEVIMRMDWKINNPAEFDKQWWNSKTLSGIYGTHENYNKSMLDHIPMDWIHSQGYLEGRTSQLNRPGQSNIVKHKEFYNANNDSISKLFESYYSVVKFPQFVYQGVIKMISLQGVLQSMNIPYVFMHLEPIKEHIRFKELYKLLDYTNFYNDVYLKKLAVEKGWIRSDNPNYPTDQAYDEFAGLLCQYLIKKKYV